MIFLFLFFSFFVSGHSYFVLFFHDSLLDHACRLLFPPTSQLWSKGRGFLRILFQTKESHSNQEVKDHADRKKKIRRESKNRKEVRKEEEERKEGKERKEVGCQERWTPSIGRKNRSDKGKNNSELFSHYLFFFSHPPTAMILPLRTPCCWVLLPRSIK